MGHTRVVGATAATAAVLLLCPALAGCTSAPTRDVGSAGATGAARPTGTTTTRATPAMVDALATGVTSAVSSAATRAASVAGTAARTAARSQSHTAPPPITLAPTHAPPPAPKPTSAPHPAPVAAGNSALESEVLSMINKERAANGLAALQFSGTLTTSARRHSAAMATAQQLSHQLPGEADLIHREAAAGYHGSAWAENVGETPQGDENGAIGLQNLLYGDPPHRANILSTSMHAVGVGIVIDSSGQLWLTEDFGG